MEMTKISFLKNKNNVFWEALIVCIFIFGVGILIGFAIESGRAESVSVAYLKSEINLLDIKVQTEVLNLKNVSCEVAVRENIKFGDNIYNDAKLFSRYEEAGELMDGLEYQHKRYDILRTLFWINSIKIKEKCGDVFDTVIYLYDYHSSGENRSKQNVFSTFLMMLKEESGNEILLIPIAKDLDVAALNLLIENYNITTTSVVVNEDLVIDSLEDLDEIRAYLSKKDVISLN